MWLYVSVLLSLLACSAVGNSKLDKLKDMKYITDELGDAIFVKEGETGCIKVKFDIADMVKKNRIRQKIGQYCSWMRKSTEENKLRPKRSTKAKTNLISGYFSVFWERIVGTYKNLIDILGEISGINPGIQKDLELLFKNHTAHGHFKDALKQYQVRGFEWLGRANLQLFPFHCDDSDLLVFACNDTKRGSLVNVMSPGYFDISAKAYVWTDVPSYFIATRNNQLEPATNCYEPFEDLPGKFQCDHLDTQCNPLNTKDCVTKGKQLTDNFYLSRPFYRATVVSTNSKVMELYGHSQPIPYKLDGAQVLKLQLKHDTFMLIGDNIVRGISNQHDVTRYEEQMPATTKIRTRRDTVSENSPNLLQNDEVQQQTRKKLEVPTLTLKVVIPTTWEIVKKHMSMESVAILAGSLAIVVGLIVLCAVLTIKCYRKKVRRAAANRKYEKLGSRSTTRSSTVEGGREEKTFGYVPSKEMNQKIADSS